MTVAAGQMNESKAVAHPLPRAQNAASTSFRFAILVLLMVQNASHGLVAKYSTTVLNESYSSSELVLVSELIKLVVCSYLSLNDKTESGTFYFSF